MPPFLDAVERLILVREGYYSSDACLNRRAAAILALDAGTRVASVARLAGCSRTTVYAWLRLYQYHRNPEALSGSQSGSQWYHSGRRGFEVAAALNAMEGRRSVRSGLGLEKPARHALRLDAHIAADPRQRRRSAILWSLDRGIPPAHVAHVAGISRQAVHQMVKRVRKADGAARPAERVLHNPEARAKDLL